MLSENKHDNTKLDHLIIPKLLPDKSKLLEEHQYLKYQTPASASDMNTKRLQ
jgi:hypothetical protein